MDELTKLREDIDSIFRILHTHLGPAFGASSVNTPHSGVPYMLDSKIPIEYLPTGDGSTEVPLGNHTHVWGYYL